MMNRILKELFCTFAVLLEIALAFLGAVFVYSISLECADWLVTLVGVENHQPLKLSITIPVVVFLNLTYLCLLVYFLIINKIGYKKLIKNDE